MNIIKICVSIILLILSRNIYAQDAMVSTPFIVALERGKNPTIRYETLLIEPVNLYIQPKPWDDNSPHIQLELIVTDSDTKHSTFLWYYNDNQDANNTPKVIGHYMFDLIIGKENTELLVDRPNFGKEFVLDFRREAVIGNLTIKFDQCVSGWNVDPHGNYAGSFANYALLLLNNNEQETFSFESLDKYDNNELLLKWKNYKVKVVYATEKFLKLIVFEKETNL